MRSLMFWLLGFVCGFFIGGMVEDAHARYRPAVAVQDEAAISCSSPHRRDQALDVARQMGATTVRINAIENMNPLFGCDPVGAVRAVAAAGFKPHVTVVGSPAYAKQLALTVGPLVGQWSVWNEINHPEFQIGYMEGTVWPRHYRRLAVKMLRVFRRYDRGSKVLIGELAPSSDVKYINTMARCSKWKKTRGWAPWMKAGGGRCKRPLRFDGIAVHAYAWMGRPEGKTGIRGYLRAWTKAARRWARERRLCKPRRRDGRGCRPVPIYVTEAGYMRELKELWGAPVYSTGQAASWLWRSWRVACQEKVRQMLHYQLFSTHQPRWDTSLINDYGPRPEFPVLASYLRNAQGCAGKGGRLGLEHGPPVAVFVPEEPPAQIIGPPLVPAPAPPDVPVLVEPPDPPRLPDPPVPEPAGEPGEIVPEPEAPLVPEVVEPAPPVVPEPAAEEPVPVVPPIEEETP